MDYLNTETRYFIERIVKSCNNRKNMISEVTEIDPIKIKKECDESGFRFFSVDYVNVNGKVFTSKPKLVSCATYFGRRYNREDLKKYIEVNKLKSINLLSTLYKDTDHFCVCDNGDIIPLYPNDFTFKELHRLEEEKVFIRK